MLDFAEAIQQRPGLFVGIDPRAELHGSNPLEHIRQYSCQLIEATANMVGGYKPQVAFFEALGLAGYELLLDIIRYAQSLNCPVIIDAKRGDIGTTAEAYAQAFLQAFPGSALTINPYMGSDTLEPFIRYAQQHKGAVFVLVKTSNPQSGTFQDLDCGGHTLYQHVAQLVHQQAQLHRVGELSRVGAVVGATYPAQVQELRTAMPHSPLLLPGLGAQGGELVKGAGMLNSASRAIYYPNGTPHLEGAVAAAQQYINQLA